MTALTQSGADFSQFSMVYLDDSGRFIDPEDEGTGETRVIGADELPAFLKRSIALPDHVTDVFVWVHGWQNDELRAVDTAKRLFANLTDWFKREHARYPNLGTVVPGYVAVHWPSSSLPTLSGYTKIRNRAKRMTTEGEAEFFLASLLGYLDRGNVRASDRKVLRARDGFYMHCLGHSFGGRFLTAAIKAAAAPAVRTRKVLAAAHRETGFDFNVDSLCVLQMAAGNKTFQTEFSELLTGPLCGPIILTHSTSDKALCTWHRLSEFEPGIGCEGAVEPRDRIGSVMMRAIDLPYSSADFSKDITNVNASPYFVGGGWVEGAHSEFWHTETLHLIASVVAQVRS
jgi:hypothetical protein